MAEEHARGRSDTGRGRRRPPTTIADRPEGVQRGAVVVPHGDHDGPVGRATPAHRSRVGRAGVEQPVDEGSCGGTDLSRRWPDGVATRRPPASRKMVRRRRPRAAGRRRGGGPCGRARAAWLRPADATAAPAVASSSSRRAPRPRRRGRIAEHPLGATATDPSASSAGRMVASGGCSRRRRVHPHRVRCDGEGATRSRPGRRASITRHRRPPGQHPPALVSRSVATGPLDEAGVAAVPLTRTTPAKWSWRDRTNSTRTLERASPVEARRRSPRARRWPRPRGVGRQHVSPRRRARPLDQEPPRWSCRRPEAGVARAARSPRGDGGQPGAPGDVGPRLAAERRHRSQ